MIKILFLAANPINTNPLNLDEEIRAIDTSLRQGNLRGNFEIYNHWAVRINDLQELLLRYQPSIVHFSGHGSQTSEIILQNDEGKAVIVSEQALSNLFKVLKDNLQCVVLNACYTSNQANSIAEHINCVIGMSESITDDASIKFSTSFYRALGYGRDIKTAFDLGCNQIDLSSLDESHKPQLIIKGNSGELFQTSENPLIVDIGSVSPPNRGIPVAEVRFTLSNSSNAPLKITSISLNILKYMMSENSLGQVPAGPIDEYFLFAKVTEHTSGIELLTQHHLLNSLETSGFFLKIDGQEASIFEFQIQVAWKRLGAAPQTSLSEIFTIEFPARSPEALLKLARYLNREKE